MDISKAIKEMEKFNRLTFEVNFVAFAEALQLGLEALRREQCNRNSCKNMWREILPSETKE